MSDEMVRYEPARITADFDAMARKLGELMEPYEGMTRESLAKRPESELAQCRADINRIIKSVEDGRKAVKKEYSRPLAEFESRIKELLAPANEAETLLKDSIEAKKAERMALKRQGLERTYVDFLESNGIGTLADVVPFDRVLDPRWLNKSFSAMKACGEIEARVESIAHDWTAVRAQRGALKHYDEVEAEFFRSLDLASALAVERKREEERAAIDALRSEVGDAPACEQESEGMNAYRIEVRSTDGQIAELVRILKELGLHGKVVRIG